MKTEEEIERRRKTLEHSLLFAVLENQPEIEEIIKAKIEILSWIFES